LSAIFCSAMRFFSASPENPPQPLFERNGCGVQAGWRA
jgi:hypothetical protein